MRGMFLVFIPVCKLHLYVWLCSESCCHLLLLSCQILEEKWEHALHQSFWIPVQSCSNIELSLCVSDGGVSCAAEVKDMRVKEIPRDKRRLHCQDSTDGRWTGHIRSSTLSSQGQCTLFMFSSNFKQSCWQCKLFSCVSGQKGTGVAQ